MHRHLRKLAVPVLVLALSSCSATEVQTNFDHFFRRSLPMPVAELIANAINMLTGDNSADPTPDNSPDNAPDGSATGNNDVPRPPLRHPGRR